MIIINDLHADVQRSAGTTPQSVLALNQWIMEWLQTILSERPGEDLLINGDLFDKFDVSNQALFQMYTTLLHHAMTGAKIILVRGNHDYAKDSAKMPSIELLYNLLDKMCDVTYIEKEEKELLDGVWVLPHLKNQDDFSAGLKRMLSIAPKVLFLHCNYDNGFSIESDHSLNLSRDMIKKFKALGTTLVLGHEHHKSSPEKNVIILGNQVPTSIYDCIGGKSKYYHTLVYPTWETMDPDKSFNQVLIEEHVSWTSEGGYLEIDCEQDLTDIPVCQFIRVKGQVAPEDFPKVNRKITDLRKSHDAFVISSALSITSAIADDQIGDSIEQFKKFNILKEVISFVKNPEQKAALEAIVMEMEVAE